jgi:hypothetical protein
VQLKFVMVLDPVAVKFSKSATVVHLRMSSPFGTVTWIAFVAEMWSIGMAPASFERPWSATILFSGRVRVPPRFVGL